MNIFVDCYGNFCYCVTRSPDWITGLEQTKQQKMAHNKKCTGSKKTEKFSGLQRRILQPLPLTGEAISLSDRRERRGRRSLRLTRNPKKSTSLRTSPQTGVAISEGSGWPNWCIRLSGGFPRRCAHRLGMTCYFYQKAPIHVFLRNISCNCADSPV